MGGLVSMPQTLRLDKREKGPWTNFEIYLLKPENVHVGWIEWIDIRSFRLKKNPFSNHPMSPYTYLIPDEVHIPIEEGLIRVLVEKIERNIKIPRKKTYGSYTGEFCIVDGYEPLKPDELPKPHLELDGFLHRLTDNWHGEESPLFSTEIAINVLSCPKSSYGIGGIGAQSLAPLGSTRDLVHLNTSLRWLLPSDFLKQNKAYMYKPIRTPDDAKSANRAYTRMISEELSFNYLFTLSPEAERLMMPTQIPVIIPDVQYTKRQWGLDRDVFDYEMSAMLIHPHIEQSTQVRLAKIVQQTGETLLRKSDMQLPLDNTGLLRLANSWARLHFKQTITEDDFTHMKNDVEGIFSEYFDFIEDAKETGRTSHHPLTQMPTRFNLTTDANKILKHIKRISRETGLERLPLAELRRGIPTSDISDYDLDRGLMELAASNLLLQFKNFTEFELV